MFVSSDPASACPYVTEIANCYDAFVADAVRWDASHLAAVVGEPASEAVDDLNTVRVDLGWAYHRNSDVSPQENFAAAYCMADPQAYLQMLAYSYRRQPDSSVAGAYQEKLAVDDPVAWEDEVAAPEQHLVAVATAPSHRMGPSSCRYPCGRRRR